MQHQHPQVSHYLTWWDPCPMTKEDPLGTKARYEASCFYCPTVLTSSFERTQGPDARWDLDAELLWHGWHIQARTIEHREHYDEDTGEYHPRWDQVVHRLVCRACTRKGRTE